MRTQDWKSHKETCTGNQKYNCFLIHPLESRDMLMDCMEPFHLQSYGNWGAEMRELRERLGWPKADEAGKFYSHQGDDTWYYYVYYPPTPTLPAWLRLGTTGKEANMTVGRQIGRQRSPSRLDPSTALSSRTGNPLSTVSSSSFHPLPTLDHRSLQLGSKFLQLDYACCPCIANLDDRLFWNGGMYMNMYMKKSLSRLCLHG
jgi:hypothetical protein